MVGTGLLGRYDKLAVVSTQLKRATLVATMALLLAGCSGWREFGIAVTPDGDIQVLSKCTDEGFASVEVTVTAVGPGASTEPETHFSYRTPPDTAEPTTVEAPEIIGIADRLGPGALITVTAAYADPALFAVGAEFSAADIDPTIVILGGSASGELQFRTVTRTTFEDDVAACGFLERARPMMIVAALVLAAAATVVAGVIVVRRRATTG